MKRYRLRNWDAYQHYRKERCASPTWIKLHVSLLASEDWVMLDDSSRVLAIACMLLAARGNGEISGDPNYIKRVACLNGECDFAPLVASGFLEIIESDACETDNDTAKSTDSSNMLATCLQPASNMLATCLQPASNMLAQIRLEENRSEKIREEKRGVWGETPLPPAPSPEPETDHEPDSELAAFKAEVVDAWNEVASAHGLPTCRVVSGGRARTLKARWQDRLWRGEWRDALARLPGSRFLLGDNDRKWQANFDWFLRPDSVTRLMEGRYGDGKAGGSRSGGYNPYDVEADDPFWGAEALAAAGLPPGDGKPRALGDT